jgi:hypothetical protein
VLGREVETRVVEVLFMVTEAAFSEGVQNRAYSYAIYNW